MKRGIFWLIVLIGLSPLPGSIADSCTERVRNAECAVFCRRGGWDGGFFKPIPGHKEPGICRCFDELPYNRAASEKATNAPSQTQKATPYW